MTDQLNDREEAEGVVDAASYEIAHQYAVIDQVRKANQARAQELTAEIHAEPSLVLVPGSWEPVQGPTGSPAMTFEDDRYRGAVGPDVSQIPNCKAA